MAAQQGSGPVSTDPVSAYRAILRTSLELRRAMRRLYKQFGLTGAQYGLLTRIPAEGIPLTQLAENAWTDPGNTSGVVDRLAREGWVRRARSESDRRVVTISLSESGKRLLAELTPRYHEAVTRLMSPLTAAERALLQEMLGRIQRGIPATPGDGSGPADAEPITEGASVK